MKAASIGGLIWLTKLPGKRGARGAGASGPESNRESHREGVLPFICGKLGYKRFSGLLASERENSIRKGNILLK